MNARQFSYLYTSTLFLISALLALGIQLERI